MHFPTFTLFAAALSLTSVIAIANPVVTLAVRDGHAARHAAFQGVAKRQDDGSGDAGTGGDAGADAGSGEDAGTGEEVAASNDGSTDDTVASCMSLSHQFPSIANKQPSPTSDHLPNPLSVTLPPFSTLSLVKPPPVSLL